MRNTKRAKRQKLRERAKESLKLRHLIRELKSVSCADCGQEYPPECMDFDHVPGRGGKIKAVGQWRTVRAVLKEARRCDVVCANCHRIRTSERRKNRERVSEERAAWLDGIAQAVEREREALQ